MIATRAGFLLLFLATGLATAGAPSASAAPVEGALHALLINGGDRPESNYLSHLHHLEDMVAVLRRRGVPAERIQVFSADGQEPAADLATRDVPPEGFWILDGTAVGARLKPQTRLIDTRWDGVTLHPARQAALREWFGSVGRSLSPHDRLLLFVTDHGTADTADPDNGAISLWREKLTVRELRELLHGLPAGVQSVMVMSQCYSGAFANAMSDGVSAAPPGDVCGFFSTTAQQKAYGCYPEGRDRDRLGHAFEFIEALGRRSSAAEAHLEVLAEDETPDVPLRTTDTYLAQLVQGEATERGLGVDALVDALLAEAWRDRATWEPELRLLDRIGTAFGTFSPRSLAEIEAREKEIEALARQMALYADTWKDALGGLQESVLRTFGQSHLEWSARLEPRALDTLGPEERARLLDELLPPLLAHAREAENGSKLETFRSHATRAAAARWRLEVRQAAFQRMRTIFVGVAGRVLVARHRDPNTRATLARLQGCESLALGAPPDLTTAPAAAAAPFPPLSAEMALLEEVSPSWLGVRFRAVPAAFRTERSLPAGANFLDTIYPDSPAHAAGLQAGDIVVGTPGRDFESTRELREWTMTSPRGVPRSLRVVRPGEAGAPDRTFEAALSLRVFPMDLPRLPDPPGAGQRAPALAPALRPVGGHTLPALTGRPYLLFFWATWCAPCKRAVPEVLALAQSRGLLALAISDEDEETVSRFLAERQDPFFSQVAVDTLRQSFRSFGVSGTPTLLLVDADGTIRHRQVGYAPGKGLTVEGWTWPRP